MKSSSIHQRWSRDVNHRYMSNVCADMCDLAVFLWITAALWGQNLGPSPGSPTLYYSSAKAGANAGWEGSITRGAAISIWAKNVGGTRGSSFVTVAGVALTSDSDYAEWGATTNPTTAKGFQRITFWLNSGMSLGNTAGIYVMVNGVQSNTLPFTIDNTGVIRFIDGVNGNDSWDGQYKDHALGGSHGPWKTAFMYYRRAGTGPGTFFYMRGGAYTAIFDPSSGHPASAYIGYFEEGGTNCTVYYPQINGTDALRYTVTSYPGEVAVFQNVELQNMSSYWTFTNFRWTGTTPLWTLSLGNEWSMCADCQLRSAGLDVIGMQFDGTMHHVIAKFGDNFRILANYVNVTPVAYSSFDITTAYPFYLSAGDTLLVADNEMHGGAMYPIHNYDEYRCNGSNDINRYMSNQTFDSNLLDMTQAAQSPQVMRAGILTGIDQPGNAYTNTVIKNNIIFSRDNLVSEAGIKLFAELNTTLNGIHIYNNTIYNVPWGLEVYYDSRATYTNVDLTNNIFSNIGSYEIYVDGGTNITPILKYNLVPQAPRVNGTAMVSNNVIGTPSFVNAPADFHLQATSPAIDAGTSTVSTVVPRDFDGLMRPQGSQYCLGAFEYPVGGLPPSISLAISPPAVNLAGGGSQQFSATVSGTTNAAVTWSRSQQVGTLSSTGLYTAPSPIATQQSIQITATSVADSTKSASATITLMPPPESVTVNPTASVLGQGQAQQFAATVSGTTNTGVTWSLSPSVGTLSAGFYTAQSSITAQQSVRITATSVADPTKSASATVTLNPPAIAVSVSVSPLAVSLTPSQSQQFAATVSGTTNTGVTWSLSPSVGTLSAGFYTPPSSITAQQSVRITATSVADPTKSAGASITLNPPAPSTAYNASWTAISAAQLKVSWTAPAGHSSYDSVTLTGYGSANWWYSWQGQTGGATNGSFVVNTPTTPGIWQFRYNSAAKNQVMAYSADLPINVSQFSVKATSTAVAPNANSTVSWTAPSGRPATWADIIGLYRIGASNDQPVWYQYTMGATSGAFSLPAPSLSGSFEFRYTLGQTIGARSATVTIQ